jgi:hypothetical protein
MDKSLFMTLIEIQTLLKKTNFFSKNIKFSQFEYFNRLLVCPLMESLFKVVLTQRL